MAKKILERYEEYLRTSYSISTARQYLRAFRAHYKAFDNQQALNRFLREKCFERGHNPFYMGFVRSVFGCFPMLGKDMHIPKSRRKTRYETKKFKYLTKEEIDYLIKKLPPYYSMLVRLYFETGLRLRELINVKYDQINLGRRVISGVGKGGKKFEVSFSDKSARILREYIMWILEKYKGKRKKYLFHKDESGKDWARSFQYYIKKYGEFLDIPGIHPHMIRHSLGHHLRVDKGFDLAQIKTVLRHSKLETTEGYATASDEEVNRKLKAEVFEK